MRRILVVARPAENPAPPGRSRSTEPQEIAEASIHTPLPSSRSGFRSINPVVDEEPRFPQPRDQFRRDREASGEQGEAPVSHLEVRRARATRPRHASAPRSQPPPMGFARDCDAPARRRDGETSSTTVRWLDAPHAAGWECATEDRTACETFRKAERETSPAGVRHLGPSMARRQMDYFSTKARRRSRGSPTARRRRCRQAERLGDALRWSRPASRLTRRFAARNGCRASDRPSGSACLWPGATGARAASGRDRKGVGREPAVHDRADGDDAASAASTAAPPLAWTCRSNTSSTTTTG
jgi:hypothetical protein